MTDVAVGCYNSGSPDPTINSDGTTPGIIVSNNVAGGNGNDRGFSITTDANGKILVSGDRYNGTDYDMPSGGISPPPYPTRPGKR